MLWPRLTLQCVRETEILMEQQPPKGAFACDHAGLVINKFSLNVQGSGFTISGSISLNVQGSGFTISGSEMVKMLHT